MEKSFPLSEDCLLRPAVAQDRWQLHGLMRYFDQTVRSPFPGILRLLGFLLLGIIFAFFFQLTLLVGAQSLVYPIGLILMGLGCKFLSVFLSQEWQKFWVIESKGRVIACAKLCPYPSYSVLYNVLVHPNLRQQGLGSALVFRMTQEAVKPLYLACFTEKVEFYRRLGFMELCPHEVPPLIRYDLGLVAQPRIVPMVWR